MKKQLTNDELSNIVDGAIDVATKMRDAAKLIDAGKVEPIDNAWSLVAALQSLIIDCGELSRRLTLRDRIQQQQADLAKLKGDQK